MRANHTFKHIYKHHGISSASRRLKRTDMNVHVIIRAYPIAGGPRLASPLIWILTVLSLFSHSISTLKVSSYPVSKPDVPSIDAAAALNWAILINERAE